MSRLIIVNGPPACGKSTLATRYVEDHPLSLNLDIDRVRMMIGGWRQAPEPSGLLARAVALAAAGTHLAAGYDVVIPQYLGRPEFLDQASQVAGEVGADYHEVVLLDSRKNALRRFAERSRDTGDPVHVQAHEMLEQAGGAAELSAMYDRLLEIIASRPATKVVPSAQGAVEQAYQQFLAVLRG